MYLSNIPIFLSSSISQNCGPFSGNPALFGPAEKAQTTLQKLSNQILTGQKSSEQLEDLSRTAQIQKDAYIPKDSSDTDALADAKDWVLEVDMGILRLWSTVFESYGHELSDFKEQLQGMDNTIQGYQDILDGKAPLQEGQNMQDILFSCAQAKVQRQQFFEYGMTYFSKTKSNGDTHFDENNHDLGYEKLINALLGECRFAKKNDSDWGIDPNASDIYSEIDRVLADVGGRVAETKRGIGRLFGLLYERGYGEKYRGYLDADADPRPSHIAQRIAEWNQKIEQLKQAALQEVVEAPLQLPLQKL